MTEKIAEHIECRFKEQYLDVLETWRSVERKSEAILGISGVIIAAIIAIGSSESLELSQFAKPVLTFVLVFLALAIAEAVSIIRSKSIMSPPDPVHLCQMLVDIESKSDIPSAAYANLLRDQFGAWKQCIESMSYQLNIKRRNLERGQTLVFIAFILLLVASIEVVIH